MAEIAVSAATVLVPMVLHSLRQMQNNQTDIQNEVKRLGDRLHRLEAYLADMEGNEGSQQLRERVKEVRDVAYDIEDVLDEFMFYVPHRFHRHTISYHYDKLAYSAKLWNPFSSAHDLLSKISGVNVRINDMNEDFDKLGSANSRTRMEEGSTSGPKFDHPLAPNIPGDEQTVGFEEHEKSIILQLTSQESSDTTISVVGPGGSGKTTIVHKVYKSKIIWRQFDCRAWVQLSQSFNMEELFYSMLMQFCESREEPIPTGGTLTQAKLWHYLQRKRYVIVLDDIWRKEHWERIHKVLPPGSSGSRIIVTTRNFDVASFCARSSHFIHNLTGLSWPVAWALFCKKAFQTANGECPPELEGWSEKIVKRCEGLPLAIVAVGSLLSKKQKFPSEWRKVHDSLGFEIGTHPDLSIMSKILLPSYTDLPTYLKSCFLYFCIFPEDYSVDRGTLVRLWIAEGFVSRKRGKTLEEDAEYYLNELIERNLVHASSFDFVGQARCCRVRSLVHEFINRKSEEVNLFSPIRDLDAGSNKIVRRISIDSDCIPSVQSRGLNYVRSVFLFKKSNLPASASAIEKILRALKFVRVLDLRDAALDKFPEAIILLNLLRYLCLRNTNIKEIPNSIKNLSHLQTLDLKQTKVTVLPKGILQLRNLRHLLIYRNNNENYVTWHSAVGVQIAGGIGALTNLQKLSLIKSDKHNETVKALKALTQLRKLGLVDLKREGGKYLCASVEMMEHLSTLDIKSTNKDESLELDSLQSPPPHLQSLYPKGHLLQFPRWISKLDNLFRIGLEFSRLPNSPLDTLQELPNLLELKMVDAFTGAELLFRGASFKKLKMLHIEQFDQLDTVVVQEGAMPILQRLCLCKCVKLEMLPLGIDKLTQIEKLRLFDMPVEFTNRLQKTNEDRWMVHHIQSIQSFVLQADGSWSREDLS